MTHQHTNEALALLAHVSRLELAIERHLFRLGDQASGLYEADIRMKLGEIHETLALATAQASLAETYGEPHTTQLWETIDFYYEIPRLLKERFDHWLKK